MRPASSLPSICARIHDGRRASIVSASVPGARRARSGVRGVAGAAAGRLLGDHGACAAESGAESRLSAHQSVPIDGQRAGGREQAHERARGARRRRVSSSSRRAVTAA
jgi:hypothetical protein